MRLSGSIAPAFGYTVAAGQSFFTAETVVVAVAVVANSAGLAVAAVGLAAAVRAGLAVVLHAVRARRRTLADARHADAAVPDVVPQA